MTRSRHGSGRSGRRQELLYDKDIPTPSHAERARTLCASVTIGTLGTIAADHDGTPYGSFVTYGLHDGSPTFLISELAEHTRNLRGDARASLLVAEPGEGDPLARARVTLVGHCAPIEDATELSSARADYLERHPGASYYADFTDFSFWKLKVNAVRYIGGYGRMSWVEVPSWSTATPDPVRDSAAYIIDHMNEDHADTMVLYCQAFSRAKDTSAATMTSVDRYGFEMSAQTEEGPRPIRVAFPDAVTSPDEVRKAMVTLARTARGELENVEAT